MIMTFNELKITDPILKAIGEKGYLAPTPIQQKGIPVALDGRDMLGIAQTGTGKTAAFAIPILQHLSSGMQAEPTDVPRRNRRGRNHGREYGVRPIRALILTPTRELAVQIGDSFSDYGKYVGLKHLTIFGGVKQGPQVEALRGGVDILIATPGRLHDLIGQGFVELDAITHFVLDEADRMLDMGFVADIKRLLPLLPKSRQTLLFFGDDACGHRGALEKYADRPRAGGGDSGFVGGGCDRSAGLFRGEAGEEETARISAPRGG